MSKSSNKKTNLEIFKKDFSISWSNYFWNKFVLKHEDKISWYHLSENPNITWEIVKANLDKPWDWEQLSRNPNITWEIVKLI